MRYLAILGSASMLALVGSASASAAIRCVSPDVASCFDTIQEAVDASSPGDTVSIRAKRDRSAYNEAVTIATEDLTIVGQGASPTFRSVADVIEFGNLRPIDLDDPDVELWLDSYPAADEFLETLANLEAFLAEDTLIDRCPPVVVQVCATAETGPGICGNDLQFDDEETGVDVFTVLAGGATFANLTLRHGAAGIRLGQDVTGTTVERVCFRDNNAAVQSLVAEDPDTGEPIPPENHGTVIQQSFVDGAGRFEGFDITGDDIVIERNLLLNALGIEVVGAGHVVSFNAVASTAGEGCVDVEGPNGLISYNVGINCNDGLVLDDAVDTTAIGNLIHGMSDRGIDADDIPEESDDPADPGNLRTIIKHNFVRLTLLHGIALGASQAQAEGNVVDRTGNEIDNNVNAGLFLVGIGNQVHHNLIRSSGFAGIKLNGPIDTSGGLIPSSGNVIEANLLTRNHTAGILLDEGFFDEDGSGEAVPVVADTTIDANRITFNDGEGVAIPTDPDETENVAATGTTLTDNFFESNRTDLCNESPTTVDGGGNVFETGDFDADCVVEPGT